MVGVSIYWVESVPNLPSQGHRRDKDDIGLWILNFSSCSLTGKKEKGNSKEQTEIKEGFWIHILQSFAARDKTNLEIYRI
jgi:hypothetical protein